MTLLSSLALSSVYGGYGPPLSYLSLASIPQDKAKKKMNQPIGPI